MSLKEIRERILWAHERVALRETLIRIIVNAMHAHAKTKEEETFQHLIVRASDLLLVLINHDDPEEIKIQIPIYTSAINELMERL